MTSYFGNENSSYLQVPSGSKYAPYVDNGPYAQKLQEAGQVAAEASFGTVGAIIGEFGGRSGSVAASAVGALIGHYSGGAIGHEIGFYIDNLSTATYNLGVFFEQLNDPSSGMLPEEMFGTGP